jgi:hypothetical protein
VTTRRNSCGPARRSWAATLASAAIGWAVLALLVQHALLLLQRVADGSLSDPAVLLRWLIGAVLGGAMLALRRAGVSLLRGREAAVFWLVVLVFHTAVAGVPAGGSPAVATPPGAIVSLLLAITALGLGSVPARIPAPASSPHPIVLARGFAPADGLVLPFSARPPPATAA